MQDLLPRAFIAPGLRLPAVCIAVFFACACTGCLSVADLSACSVGGWIWALCVGAELGAVVHAALFQAGTALLRKGCWFDL